MIKKLSVIAIGCLLAVSASAERYDVYIHEPAKVTPLPPVNPVDLSSLGDSFEEGRKIRQAWEARKARKKHEQAMKELQSIDLNNQQAVMQFVQKYPEELETVKNMLWLNQQMQQ